MLPAIHLLLTLLLIGVFALSSATKLRDRESTRIAVRGFLDVPERAVRILAWGVPAVEAVLALGLASTPTPAFSWFAAAALGLLIGFAVLVGTSLRLGRTPSCFCFGEASSEPISVNTFYRNLGLVALGVLVLADFTFPGVLSAWRSLSAPFEAWVLTAAIAMGVVARLASRLVVARRDLGVHRDRIATLEADLASRPLEDKPVTAIPDGVIFAANDREISLQALVADRAQLVLGVSPGCGACKEISPLFGIWREAVDSEIGITVLSRGGREEAIAAGYGGSPGDLFTDPNGASFEALGLAGTPGAVLLGADGTVAAGPALGIESIAELVNAIIQAIGLNMITGASMKGSQPRHAGGEDSGDDFLPDPDRLVPSIDVETEHGQIIDLRFGLTTYAPGADIPVIAWSASCAFCREIVEEIKQFHDRRELILLVAEPIETVRAQGLYGPVLRTTGQHAPATVLEVPGTPAGYPVNNDGVMSPGGGVGGGSVLRMLIDRAQNVGSLVETPAITAILARQHEISAGDADGHTDPETTYFLGTPPAPDMLSR